MGNLQRYIVMVFLLSVSTLQAQVILSGRVVDSAMQALGNASVTYRLVGESTVQGYAMSRSDGSFRLESKVSADSIELVVSHISYQTWRTIVPNRTADYTVHLKASYTALKEVVVGPMPIFRRKDTINYDAKSFTSKEDRVIGDVIRKLPGIDMQGGQIYYQGQPIQKYMVNNLDLMEGRYRLINDNLPTDVVKSVQVIENDQPIKVLDSLVFSDRASLNLVLKRFTTTGSGKVGAGLAPALWDVNITPITLGKTFQMLNSIQSNNTGNDVSQSLRAFYTGGSILSNNEAFQEAPSFIDLRHVASPGFTENRWLDNRIFMATTNTLQKLQNGLELKGNISYYNDLRKRQGHTSTRFLTSDHAIVTDEAVDNQYGMNALDVGLALEKNEKNVYLRNTLKYRGRWNRDRGDLLLNDRERIMQHRGHDDHALMNSFSMARFLGKQLVNIGSTVEWHRTPQRLSVVPGQLAEVLNDGIHYGQMTQNIRHSSFRTDNSLGFTRRMRRWSLSPRVGIHYRSHALESFISVVDDNDQAGDLGPGYSNDMRSSQVEFTLGSTLQYERNRWKLDFRTPYSFSVYDVVQRAEKPLSGVSRSTFKPSATASYSPNAYNELSVTASGGREFLGLDNFYDAFIVSSYRSVQRYESKLLATDRLNTTVRYRYSNTLKANFANASYAYTQSSRDYTFQNTVDALGQITVGISDQPSTSHNHGFIAGVARFFPAHKTIVRVNGSVDIGVADYLLNEVMARRKTRGIGGTFEIINNLSDVITGEYRFAHNQLHILMVSGVSNRLVQNNHHLTLSLYAKQRHSISLMNSYYGNNIPGQENQYFLDATYRYRIQGWNTDIELSALNLFNNNHYVQQFSKDYQLVWSHFELRPRQFLVSTRFRF